ncbi:MAG TPA: transcription termination/antitermination NusG family protein, partial [Candidatus Absconditabacterales bacterium]|nr:transcription termination/antitermination NusG family protein [Candidatus Absconditabacterales bacterium]
MVQEQNIGEIRKQIQDNTFRWYVLSVVSGQEQLVIDNMKERIQKQGLSEDVVDYLSPIVNEYSMRKGEKITKQKKLYPGYV